MQSKCVPTLTILPLSRYATWYKQSGTPMRLFEWFIYWDAYSPMDWSRPSNNENSEKRYTSKSFGVGRIQEQSPTGRLSYAFEKLMEMPLWSTYQFANGSLRLRVWKYSGGLKAPNTVDLINRTWHYSLKSHYGRAESNRDRTSLYFWVIRQHGRSLTERLLQGSRSDSLGSNSLLELSNKSIVRKGAQRTHSIYVCIPRSYCCTRHYSGASIKQDTSPSSPSNTNTTYLTEQPELYRTRREGIFELKPSDKEPFIRYSYFPAEEKYSYSIIYLEKSVKVIALFDAAVVS